MSKIEQLEQQIEDAKAVVDQRNMVLKLTSNREFRKLIIEGFMRDEAARFVHLSTEPGMKPEARADCLGQAQAAGYFKRWLNHLITMGDQAEEALRERIEVLDELRAEQAGA